MRPTRGTGRAAFPQCKEEKPKRLPISQESGSWRCLISHAWLHRDWTADREPPTYYWLAPRDARHMPGAQVSPFPFQEISGPI